MAHKRHIWGHWHYFMAFKLLHWVTGKLTCEHLEAVVDARTFSRLKDLLDGLATIGLLAPSLVRTDSSGQSAGLREARWAAAAHAVLEEPALAQGGWPCPSMAGTLDGSAASCGDWIVGMTARIRLLWLMLCGKGLHWGKGMGLRAW